MLATVSVTMICNQTTCRAIFLSLASTSKSARMIAAFSEGVKHCCSASETSSINLFALFEPVQELIKLVMICIFNDQFAAAFIARLDFHTCSKMCAQLFLQTLRIATELGFFLGFVFFFRVVSLFLHEFFRIAKGKLVQNDFVGE